MTNKDLVKVIQLLDLFTDFETWTKDKHNIIDLVLKYMHSGIYEYFTSNCIIHGCYVGNWYIEQKGHVRRGTLKKYRSNKIIVMCVGHGSYNVREYIVAVIE